MPKIDRNGRVSYEADAKASAAEPVTVSLDASRFEAAVAEAKAKAEELDATQAAPVVPEPDPAAPVPAPPARTPPRRAAPPGAAGG